MTVQINWEHSRITNEEERVELILENPEKDESYASWMAYSDKWEGNKIDTFWTWENPEEPIEDVTLSPSLKLNWDDPNTFHIFVKNGEIEHCGDCQCGCKDD